MKKCFIWFFIFFLQREYINEFLMPNSKAHRQIRTFTNHNYPSPPKIQFKISITSLCLQKHLFGYVSDLLVLIMSDGRNVLL